MPQKRWDSGLRKLGAIVAERRALRERHAMGFAPRGDAERLAELEAAEAAVLNELGEAADTMAAKGQTAGGDGGDNEKPAPG